MADSAHDSCSHDTLAAGKNDGHAQPETTLGLLERARAAVQVMLFHNPMTLLHPPHQAEESSLLQRSRAAGQVLTQDDQPSQGKDGKDSQAQDHKQGQQESSEQKQETGQHKPDAPQEKENTYWTDRVTGGRSGPPSGGNQGSSGNAGNQGNASTDQDGYERGRGRSLPDEQKENDPTRGRGR